MRKRHTFVALLAAVFLLSSCGINKVAEDLKMNPVTLTFSTFYEEGVQADAYKEIIKAFEASHKNIKINFQSGASDYDEKIQSAIKSGEGPDIIGLQRNRMLEYAKDGKLKDITSWVESEGLEGKYYGVSLGYGKYNGKYYGLGDLPNTVELFYNTDLFKKAGLSEPQNLDELIDTCKKLRKYTKMPIIMGAKDTWVTNTFFGIITGQTVKTEELSKAFTSGDRDEFENLAGIDDAISAVSQLVKSGAIDKGVANYDYKESIDAFIKGKAAILITGSWGIEMIEKAKTKGFKYKSFDSPIEFNSNPNSKYSATAVQVITVNDKTKHKSEVMEFMSYLFSEEAQEIFADKNGISGMKSVNTGVENEVNKQVIKHLELTDEDSTMYIDNISEKMMNATHDKLRQLIEGKLSSSNVWSKIVNESYN